MSSAYFNSTAKTKTRTWLSHWLWNLDDALEAASPFSKHVSWRRWWKGVKYSAGEAAILPVLLLGPILYYLVMWTRVVLAPIAVTLETVYERVQYRKVLAQWKQERAEGESA